VYLLPQEVYPACNTPHSLLIAVNEEYCRPDRPLEEGDTLAIFPPVSGG